MENNSRALRVGHAAALAGAALACAALAACGSPRRGEPLKGPLLTTEASQDRGRLVFMNNCYKCHPGGEAGLGPSLNDKLRPRGWTRYRIRHAFGAMPSFDEKRIDAKELDDLMSYLTALRRYSDKLQEPIEAQAASR
jgi:mono/diheme cytochrome c family protein